MAAKQNPFKAFFAALNKLFKSKFKDFAKASLAVLKADLGQLASKAVADVQASANFATLTDPEKRANALSILKADGKDLIAKGEVSGFKIGDSFLNLLIELAINKAKGVFSETGSTK